MKIILVALVFNGLDLVTGIVGAVRGGEQIKSSKLRDGLFKKVGFVFCYALGVLINYAENFLTLPFGLDLVPVICTYAIITEVVSIIENIYKINSDILPDKLKELIGYNGGK
jgi:phage-related holin|nr:MAG TPA: holin [Caudoviricetes sp.]